MSREMMQAKFGSTGERERERELFVGGVGNSDSDE